MRKEERDRVVRGEEKGSESNSERGKTGSVRKQRRQTEKEVRRGGSQSRKFKRADKELKDQR